MPNTRRRHTLPDEFQGIEKRLLFGSKFAVYIEGASRKCCEVFASAYFLSGTFVSMQRNMKKTPYVFFFSSDTACSRLTAGLRPKLDGTPVALSADLPQFATQRTPSTTDSPASDRNKASDEGSETMRQVKMMSFRDERWA